MNGITYEKILGITSAIDPINYRERYEGIFRNAEGIPLHLEDEVERRARVLADAYERLYDLRKEAMRNRGVSFSQLGRADDGDIVAVNFAAVVSVPVFMQAVQAGDGPLFSVMVLHWMRATKEKEWVFSHLCEAVYAFKSLESLRVQIPEESHETFEDLQAFLEEAIYHYNHRHC